jgi:biotin carboxyl carrier protein
VVADILVAILSTETEPVILAPMVGLLRSDLVEGAGVIPGQQIGTLEIGARIHPLIAPDGARGPIIRRCLEAGLQPVDYGRQLFVLGQAGLLEGQGAGPQDTEDHGSEARAKQIAVRSPTEGIFYRRPDPQSPAYVEMGSVIETGHPLGLIEVMKCFNQVRYDGPGMPRRARVVAVSVEDAAEILYDQVLFLVEAAE